MRSFTDKNTEYSMARINCPDCGVKMKFIEGTYVCSYCNLIIPKAPVIRRPDWWRHMWRRQPGDRK